MTKTQFFLWVGSGIVVFALCLFLVQRDYYTRISEIKQNSASNANTSIDITSLQAAVKNESLKKRILLYEPVDITDYHSDIMMLYP